MDKTLNKEELKKQKEEEKIKMEEDALKKFKEIDLTFKNIKVKRDNISNNYTNLLKDLLPFWRNKYKNEKITDELFNITTRLVEFGLGEKDLLSFQDKISSDEKADLIRYFHVFYDRFSRKLNCSTLKPAKIYGIHQGMIEKEGVGIVGRALFSIQK